MKKIFALSLVLGACGAEPSPQVMMPPDHMMMPSPSPSPSTSPSPSPTPAPVQDGRSTRRVSVAQMRKAIPALFNGLTWTGGNPRNPVPMFDLMARTLGEANYLSSTEENLEPNPIFAKFMDDMAGQVCAAAVAADRAAPAAQDKMVLPYAADPARNLRFLRLKLHGIYVPENSTEGLENLQALYDGVLGETSSADQAWTGVCIAMLTAPELMAY